MSTSQRSALRRRIGLLSWDPLGSAKKGSRSSFMKKRKTNGTPGLLVLKKRSTRSRFSSAGVSAALLCAVGPAGVRCGGICSANRAQILARAAGRCHLRLCAWHLAGWTVLGASHVRWRLVCRQTQAWCMLGCPPVCMHHLGFDVISVQMPSIFVRTLNGSVAVPQEGSVSELKQEIEARAGVAADCVRLAYNGHILQDDELLEDLESKITLEL